MSSRPSTVKELLAQEFPKLYAFAFQMSGSRGESERFLQDLSRQAKARPEQELLAEPDPGKLLLGMVARHMEENLGRKAEHTFEKLDTILRSDLTRPIDLRAAGMDDDPTKVHVMLWELKRTCLTAVLGCLPPGVRLSFVLTDLLGFSPAEAAELLDIKESAYRVRLTRARKRIEDYLTPRCYHVDRQNPCTCTGRLMIAIDNGFIKQPPHTLDIPHEPHDGEGPRRDMGGLYRSLPEVVLTEADLRRLMSEA
jgi:RNA polymerase sigma-70 factor (ECF subfamily)